MQKIYKLHSKSPDVRVINTSLKFNIRY